MQLDGGPDAAWLLPNARVERLACLLTTCEAHRSLSADRLAGAPTPPSWLAWAFGIGLAALVGFGVGYGLKALGL